LSGALAGLAAPNDPNLLVGIETSDDAAVYRLTDEIAMINTVDFITPPVDDPYWFGQISAANSISDVYSMGGRPLTALNVVMFPAKHLDMGVLRDILRGGHDKVVEAGAVLVGGHTIDDDEPKYGLSVSGVVHPEHIITNAAARPGDALILTKPIGTGVIFNALRAGKIPYAGVERDVLPTVAALNKAAMEAALAFDLHSCTDVTGFGLAGHAFEMAAGSGTRIVLNFGAVPIYPGALEMYRRGVSTGNNPKNRAMLGDALEIRAKLSAEEAELLVDPQTSGGLLLALPEAEADALMATLSLRGIAAARIGAVEAGAPAVIVA
jgi:selenide,water dikinase